MEIVKEPLYVVRDSVNKLFTNKEPWQIVSITAAGVYTSMWLWDLLTDSEGVVKKSRKTFFKYMKRIPAIRRKIEAELNKMNDTFVKEAEERYKNVECVSVLPKEGMTREQILEEINNQLNLGHFEWTEGKVSGAVYCYDDELRKITTEVYGLASYTNPLHSDVFPGVIKMEAEVVKMTANLFNGGPEACGTMTTGGTESILMACKAYRDMAIERGITKPEMVIPITAHSAFDKASQYFKIGMRIVPVDPKTLKVDVNALKRAISCRTCMIVASAPNYPYGTMDDVEAIAAIGAKKGIPVHVDACLGGFLLVFMKAAGFNVAPFDFSVKGVTSISADTHKYGYAPKGSSVILYKEPKYRHYQYTVTTEWPGGVYGSPTVNGSRAGGVIAACWASMRYFGMDRYVENTKKIIDTTRYIEKRLRAVPGIFIFGECDTSVVAMGSKDFDIFRLSDALSKSGWNLNALQFPSGIHISVTLMHTKSGVADKFIEDIEREVAILMKDPEKPVEGKMAIYGVAQSLPDRSLVGDIVKYFIDSNYILIEKK